MSFILDALRKSDQRRHRGAAPTLLTSPSLAAEPKQPAYWMQAVLAAVLIAAGIAIGWLRPWQTEQPAVQSIASVTTTPASTPRQAAPAVPTAWPEMNTTSAQQPPIQKPVASAASSGTATAQDRSAPSPSSAEARGMPVTAASIEPPTPPSEKPASASAPKQKVIAMSELPASIRQELPAMHVLLHQYSPRPKNRFVTINNQTLQEGESVAPGITLEQITPDGMTLSYKGYHFRRGVLQ